MEAALSEHPAVAEVACAEVRVREDVSVIGAFIVRTDGTTPDAAETTKFLLAEIPEDAVVGVDSHSSSPIFSDQTAQLIFQARKIGDVDAEYMLSNLPFPNAEIAINAARKRAAEGAQKQEQLTEAAKQMPMDVQGKILEKQLGRK